jgi:hypothetical protein
MEGELDPISFKRVRYRVNTLIEVLPTSAKAIYSDTLLSNIREDLIWIRDAIDTLAKRDTTR